ncbi:MAG TPA: chromosome segregation protein SMC, partial [Marmoricola sp.]|nr:chromosome segregation protein SMC [Marmoricola sp.]
IEEAAGVLKHRKRKEKAVRKLDSTEGNLTRLNDLLTEIRRQLKPLGRQAEVARRAQTVQAEVRDARARLLADDLARARESLAQEMADESVLIARRAEVESQLNQLREQESSLELALREDLPALSRAQETYHGLTGLRERIRGTASLAAERVRNAQSQPEIPQGRDPDELEAEAERASVQEAENAAQVESRQAQLNEAIQARQLAEKAFHDAEQELAVRQRAAADSREGIAKLIGKVNALKSRAAAADDELGRLASARAAAIARAERAQKDFTVLESTIAGLDAGEEGLDAEHEAASSLLADIEERLTKLRESATSGERERAALAARKEALEVGLNRKDGAGALLAASDSVSGLLGSVAALISVRPGYEAAVATALGDAANAIAVTDSGSAIAAIGKLKDDDLGRAGLLLGDARESVTSQPNPPEGAIRAIDVVECPTQLRPALSRLLSGMVVVADLATARRVVAQDRDLTVVTRDGDLLGAHYASGGSSSTPSLIEVQAAVDEATEKLRVATAALERQG